MEETDKVDPVYLKGFNEGYLIAQHMPELAQVLADVESTGERIKGLKAGRSQFDKEQNQVKSHLPNWLKSDRSVANKTLSAKSKGRDIEPEK